MAENRPRSTDDPHLTNQLIDHLLNDTQSYWLSWIKKCNYVGRWREFVIRSALAIKVSHSTYLICVLDSLEIQLLTFAPTGAIVAAPTFSLPEDLHGAGRNWDYRQASLLILMIGANYSISYSWLRDSSFSVYALMRVGLTEEADRELILDPVAAVQC